jgi:hypothetical protein
MHIYVTVTPFLSTLTDLLHPSSTSPYEQKSEEVLKAAVGLLGDLGQIFGSRMSQVYHMPFVKSVITTLLLPLLLLHLDCFLFSILC